MRLWLDGVGYEGRVVDLRFADVDGAAIARAVRGEALTPRVEPTAGSAVYRYGGHVWPGMGLRTRTALAAAARSRGVTTPHDSEIEDLRERLASLDPDRPSLPATVDPVDRQRVSELRETVAAHRGRVTATERLPDGDPSEARADLRETVARLSERETERTAARQARERRREIAREYRAQLDERRRVADRLANLERSARTDCVDAVSGQFADALDSLPGPTPSDPFDADPVPAALAILRLADTDAPVVLAVDRFDSPATAVTWLGAPVVRC